MCFGNSIQLGHVQSKCYTPGILTPVPYIINHSYNPLKFLAPTFPVLCPPYHITILIRTS